jgi:phage terminase large subunit-like protein
MSFEDKEAKWQAETFVYLFHLLPFLPPPCIYSEPEGVNVESGISFDFK